MIRWLIDYFRDDAQMSSAWLERQQWREMRSGDTWAGIRWTRPRDPLKDEAGWWNRRVEAVRRKRA